MTHTATAEFDFTAELHKTVVQSLATSFGLDFLLFEDKRGGDVMTTHNVREWQKELKAGGKSDIHVEESFSAQFNNDGTSKTVYDSKPYHQHEKYIDRGKKDKESYRAGTLHDAYRNTIMSVNEERQLDHVVSAHEIHHDAARILADADGVQLANQESNFQSTHSYINNRKREHGVDKFVDEIVPKTIASKKNTIEKQKIKLSGMPDSTPEQRNERRKLEDKIRKNEEHIKTLESIDKEAMRKADKTARDALNKEIDQKYYTGSKFLTAAAADIGTKGIKMGMRQALGIMLAEIWFELKAKIPEIIQNMKSGFDLGTFFQHIKETIGNILTRIKEKFKEMISAFLNGGFAGILSSLTTTLLNMVFTGTKMISKLIRETWNSLVQAAKLLFFNPQKLPLGDLLREVSSILAIGVATFLGTMLNQQLNVWFAFPFGSEIAAFLSALATGIVTIGLNYFFHHSEMMKKVWAFFNQLTSKYADVVAHFKKINAELDRYLTELAKVELSMNPEELLNFSDALYCANSEYERALVLNAEIVRRKIALPFESGNTESTRNWLKNL